jgi:phage N-6-adenine-methyltransferase
MNPVHYSSKTVIWATPQALFDELNAEFNLDVDVCALEENAKLPVYFTPEQDGLAQDWSGLRCWMNPPYGREISKWVEKAATGGAAVIVALLPSRTDTRWWHSYIQDKAEVRFIKGRLKFGDSKNCAPFPNAIVIFRNS